MHFVEENHERPLSSMEVPGEGRVSKFHRGYLHVYTGEGKGKTTAALGLALRAAGAGLRVLIAQFAKGMPSSERNAISRFSDRITLKHYGANGFIRGEPGEEDKKMAQLGLEEVKQMIQSGLYQLVILDEGNMAIFLKLLSVSDLLELIRKRPKDVELVMTGRNAHPDVLEEADLVTEMREVKHYFRKGVSARVGIEK